MKANRKIIFCILITAFISFSGCSNLSFKNYGRIVPDNVVTDAFVKFQIDNNFNYYISGSDEYPTSILGLDKTYTLDTDVWKEMEMTSKIFTNLVTHMRIRLWMCCFQNQQGYTILDDKGNKIGIWYSMLSGSIVVKMKGTNKVTIYPPSDTDDYKAYEEKLGR